MPRWSGLTSLLPDRQDVIAWLGRRWRGFRDLVDRHDGNMDTRVSIALIFGAILLLFGLGFLAATFLLSRVEDTLAREAEAGPSRSVAELATVMDHELDDWAPNKPWWSPIAPVWGDNMDRFQRGIAHGVLRTTFALGEHGGRVRGTAVIDADLLAARNKFSYEPDRWVTSGLAVTEFSVTRYRDGVASLRAYNARLERGDAVLERRADALIAMMEVVVSDIGAIAAELRNHVNAHEDDLFDGRSDDVFYEAKGRLYVYTLFLRGLRQDYAEIIAEKRAEEVWAKLEQTMNSAITDIRPLAVGNAPRGSFWRPNHLANLGFDSLTARTQLRELTDILSR